MKYLLDVNALIALGFAQHEFHRTISSWLRRAASPTLITCAITELGFVRVLAGAPAYGITVEQARTLLVRLRRGTSVRFAFLDDGDGARELPGWVRSAPQVTDGHLTGLAQHHGLRLVTFDRKIPGAVQIPLS